NATARTGYGHARSNGVEFAQNPYGPVIGKPSVGGFWMTRRYPNWMLRRSSATISANSTPAMAMEAEVARRARRWWGGAGSFGTGYSTPILPLPGTPLGSSAAGAARNLRRAAPVGKHRRRIQTTGTLPRQSMDERPFDPAELTTAFGQLLREALGVE